MGAMRQGGYKQIYHKSTKKCQRAWLARGLGSNGDTKTL